MKILEVAEGSRATGSSAAALAAATALSRRGHHVTWLCRKNSRLARDAKEAGLSALEELRLSMPALCTAGRKISELAAEADLVHVHRSKGHLAALLGMGFSKRSKPLARTCHAGQPGEAGVWARWLAAKAEALVVRSAALAFDLQELSSPEGARLAVIPGGVDASRFQPGQEGLRLRTDLELTGQLVIGTVSHLKSGRQLLNFCMAAEKLCRDKALEKTSFLVVGRGQLGKSLTDWIRKAGLAERVKVFDPKERFAETLAALDVGVLLVPGSDGSARAALEMAAMAKPMVVGDVGALADLAGTEGQCARRVKPQCVDEIAAAMSELALDPELRKHLGSSARKRFEERHTLERLGEHYEKLFESLLEGKS